MIFCDTDGFLTLSIPISDFQPQLMSCIDSLQNGTSDAAGGKEVNHYMNCYSNLLQSSLHCYNCK